MNYALVKNGVVENIILADDTFVAQIASQYDLIEKLDTVAKQLYGIGWTYVNGIFTAPVVNVVAPVVLPKKPVITRRAFQNRFPLAANGVSTKYDLLTAFMTVPEYAATIVPVQADRISLMLLITTGVNRLNVSPYVDFTSPDAANFTGLLMQATIPVDFQLTAIERNKILDQTTILDSERPS